jgi:hypothetical protein
VTIYNVWSDLPSTSDKDIGEGIKNLTAQESRLKKTLKNYYVGGVELCAHNFDGDLFCLPDSNAGSFEGEIFFGRELISQPPGTDQYQRNDWFAHFNHHSIMNISSCAPSLA